MNIPLNFETMGGLQKTITRFPAKIYLKFLYNKIEIIEVLNMQFWALSSPLGLLKFHKLKPLVMCKLPFSKSFWDNLNYGSTANIREVTKSNSVGDQSFETNFNLPPGYLTLKLPFQSFQSQ